MGQDGICVITGGGKGLGEALTRTFHGEGYKVLIGSRRDSGLAATLGERARFMTADVRRQADHLALAEAAQAWGRLCVYVNNAGFSEWRPIEDVDETFLNAMLDTTLKGVFFGCQAAARHLGPGGAIVNVSSLAGKRGSANNSAYCAAKFGVNGVTQALAKELGPRGIRVNAVCPVYVRTEGVLKALEDPRSPTGGQPVDDYLRRFAEGNAALGRLPTGREVAELCLFLASDRASAITGQCINVDCGVLPQ